MNCRYLKDGRCGLAELLLEQEVGVTAACPTSERQCGKCVERGVATEDAPTSQVLGHGLVACPKRHRTEWKAFANFIQNGVPRGLGDRVAKVTKVTGIAGVVKAVTKAVGAKGCGCGGRQRKLNKMFPTQSTQDSIASNHETPGDGGPL